MGQELDLPELHALREALVRERRVSEALSEVGKALGTTLDLDDLLELILGRVTELLDADRATLYLVDEVRGDLVSRVVVGDAVRSIRVKLGHGLAGAVARSGKPIRVDDAYQDERFERDWDRLTGYRTSTMLAVPLKNHLGRTIGVIQVLNKKAGALFRDEDEVLLTALGTQAAVAIDNSRLFLSLIQKNRQLLDTKEQLERRVTDLQLLFDLERATARAKTLDELIQAALTSAARSCEARGAALVLADDDTGDLVEYVLDSETPEELVRFGVKAGEGFLGDSMTSDLVIQLHDGASDPRFSENAEGRYRFAVTAVLCVPLQGQAQGERAPGALGLFTKAAGRPFGEEDVSLLNLVGANVATAVRLFRSNLARENEQRLTTIGRLLSQVIHDFKTPMTVISGHVQLMQHEESAERRHDHAAKILRQFDVLVSMQREVLAFARGESKIFLRKVYLHKFFNDLRAQLGHEVDGRAIELEMEVDSKAVARFDETKMARAMQNLTRNAIEAMAERGGRLTLFGHIVNGNEVVLGVADTGPGIPKEIEGRLFQSFVTAGKKGGTGLGLAIVKKIAEEHRGSVVSHSSPDGARFELHIPLPSFPSTSIPPPSDKEPLSTDALPGDAKPTKKKSSPRKSRPKSRVPKDAPEKR